MDQFKTLFKCHNCFEIFDKDVPLGHCIVRPPKSAALVIVEEGEVVAQTFDGAKPVQCPRCGVTSAVRRVFPGEIGFGGSNGRP